MEFAGVDGPLPGPAPVSNRSGGGAVLRDVLAIVLAGGRGSRLEPLTRDRAKPAVPFGGIYRIIDFTLSNCLNSDLRKILVLTQYKAVSLNRHIDQGWKFLSRELDEYVEVIPPSRGSPTSGIRARPTRSIRTSTRSRRRPRATR